MEQKSKYQECNKKLHDESLTLVHATWDPRAISLFVRKLHFLAIFWLLSTRLFIFSFYIFIALDIIKIYKILVNKLYHLVSH